MILKRQLHWIIIVLFFANCARQTSPTGGPKDTIPPKLLSSNPAHRAINFSGKNVELTFSEFIILNTPKEQLIITPSPGKGFEVTAKKNKVIIDFEKDLLDSTTYTFNFREAVQDITEKNPAKNLLVAISTGSYLDSLSIEGKLVDLLKATELKDITVAITQRNDTFNILKHPASYFTKTNDKGNFKIDYLRPGTYTIYAIDDKNRNLFADSRTESYGFLATPLILNNDTSKIEISILRLDARPLKLSSARPYNTYFNIKANKNLKAFRLTSQDSLPLFYNFGEDQSTIKLYNTFPKLDSVAISLQASDSIGNKLDTLIYAKFPEREADKEKFQSTVGDTKIYSEQATLHATINFSKPVAITNIDSLYFKRDSLTIVKINPSEITWNQRKTEAKIKKSLNKSWYQTNDIDPTVSRPGTPAQTKSQQQDTVAAIPVLNELNIRMGAFISVEQDSSKTMTQKITPLKIEDLAMFLYEIKTSHKHIIIQLLDRDLKVIQEKYDIFKGNFENVEPGDYSIRVVIDANANKEWDPGNYLKNIEPEKIHYFKTEDKKTQVNLKANWEFDFPPLLITP